MISNSQIDEYSRAIDKVCELAKMGFNEKVLALVDAFVLAVDEPERALFRDAIIDEVYARCSVNASIAAELADEFFSQVAAAEAFPVALAPHQDTSLEAVDARVRSAAKVLFAAKPNKAAFVNRMESFIERQVSMAANDAMADNVEAARNRKVDLRYARMTASPEPCGFCFMLSSRGFVYRTRFDAGDGHRFHSNCKCRVVPGIDGKTRVEGYDPEGMQQRWAMCRKTCGSDDAKSIIKECETRDAEWLWTGKEPKPIYLKPKEAFIGAPDEKDLLAHAALSRNGFAITVREENAPEGYSNIDLEINQQLWEIKSPKSGNERAVESNLRKAKKQFGKQYKPKSTTARVVFNGQKMELSDEKVAEELVKRTKQHGIEEVLQIRKNGTVKRLRA